MEVNKPIEFKAGETRCPRCKSKDLVPSMPRGLLDEIMRGRQRVPRHCRGCGKRFYVRDPRADEPAGTAE